MTVRWRRGLPGTAVWASLLAAMPAGLAVADITFHDPLSNAPLDVPPPEGAKRTDTVKHFHETGEDAYFGNAEAIAAGQKLYARWCASCHLPDATGRIGPNLVDDEYRYPRVSTPIGTFEVIYAGATGAMQSFKSRLSQDEILQIVAFLHSLQKS
jgi:cytochrome c-L